MMLLRLGRPSRFRPSRSYLTTQQTANRRSVRSFPANFPRRPRYHTISVVVPVPVSLKARTVPFHSPKIVSRRSRYTRFALAGSASRRRERYVERRVRVVVPAFPPSLPAAYTQLYRRGDYYWASHAPRRAVRRLLQYERNRRRYQEHKESRRKFRNGQMNSLRHDRHGIVAEAARRGYSAKRLNEAAMVSRGLDYPVPDFPLIDGGDF